MRQELGGFGLLDFTKLRPVLAVARFETYEPFTAVILIFFRVAVNRR
jgi:hypothetical protein